MAEFLIDMFQNDPTIEEINLDYKEIEDLEELLPILAKFDCLKSLSLADNRLMAVPHDLSCLEGVEDINLNGNVFQDLKQVVISLTTMPSLRSLHINLHEEEQVDFIFRNMPTLEVLNDTAVERDDFEAEGEDQNQYGEEPEQQYEQEPEQQYDEEQEPQYDEERENQYAEAHNGHYEGEQEEIEEEQFDQQQQREQFEQQQLQQEQEQEHPQHLEHLEQEVEGEDEHEQNQESEAGNDDVVIKPEDLEIIAVLYDAIRDLRRRIDEENDKNLAEDFDKHLKEVMSELNESITADEPNHIKSANLLKAKFSLYEICFTKAVEYMKEADPDAGNIFQGIQEGLTGISNNFYDLAKNSGGAETEVIRHQLIEKENEATEVIETANALNLRFEKEMKDKENQKRTFDRERNQLKKQVEALEAENKKLLDTLIRHSKGEDTDVRASNSRSGHTSGHPLFRGTQSKKFNRLQGPVGKTNIRTLTLKQLKDVINDIYAQKLKYDQK